MENLDERIKDVMAGVFGIDAESINEDSSQDNIEGWDSIKHLDLIVSLEDEFGISIPLDEVPNMVNMKYIKMTLAEFL